MIRSLALIAVASLLYAVPVRAAEAEREPAKKEEKKPPSDKIKSVTAFFKHWKQALDRSAVENRFRKGRRSIVVAAVRGSKQGGGDPDKPYWKGGWTEKRAAERMKEREELSAAVALILEGKTGEGSAALNAFEKKHPKSSYVPDLEYARTKIGEMKKESAPAAVPEKKDAVAEEKSVEKKEEPVKKPADEDEAD